MTIYYLSTDIRGMNIHASGIYVSGSAQLTSFIMYPYIQQSYYGSLASSATLRELRDKEIFENQSDCTSSELQRSQNINEKILLKGHCASLCSLYIPQDLRFWRK